MKTRKVSSDVFATKTAKPKALTPRQKKRLELEASLEKTIKAAAKDPSAAYVVTLGPDEKVPTLRAAFKRVKTRTREDAVNLVTVDGSLYIAVTPQRRGRRSKKA